MSLTKRGKTWHTHFFVDGQRFRQSLETSDWREAQRKERDLMADARAGKLAATKDDFSRLPFAEAAERFLLDRVPHLAPRSIQTERERVKPINKSLGEVAVWRMTPTQVVGYIRERKTAGRSNATINRELDVIRGVLKRAKRWHHFSEEIHPLPVRQNIGRALTYEEKVKLLRRAGARPEWQTVACAARLALNTTMRGCEIKQMRWRDVDMIERSLTIRKSKTEAGERVIPLNADAWAVILELYGRSQALAGIEPSHFLFPSCETAHFDPTRAIKSWRTAWRRLTRAVQCAECGLLQNSAEVCVGCKASIANVKSPFESFRFHDLRHQAITELAESKASDSTIMSIAGHVSPKMLAHYSHVRLDAKRNALDALTMRMGKKTELEGTSEGYDTNNDTRVPSDLPDISQIVDSLVELSGIEPLTSSLRTRRSPS